MLRIGLLWVSDHRTFRDNALAGDLARLGAARPIMGSEPAVEISYSHIKETCPMWKGKRGERLKAANKPRPFPTKNKPSNDQKVCSNLIGRKIKV